MPVELVSVAPILLLAWIALLAVARAIARVAGLADAETERAGRLLARGQGAHQGYADQAPPDALADDLARAETRAARSTRRDGPPGRDRQAPAPQLKGHTIPRSQV